MLQAENLRRAQSEPLTLPPISKLLRGVTDEELAGLFTPQGTIDSLKLSTRQLAITQLHRELRSGRLAAFCDEGIINFGAQVGRSHKSQIDPWIWRFGIPNAEADFWETGYHFFTLPETVGGSGVQGTIELFGVRFGWVRGRSEHNTKAVDQPSQLTPLPKAEAERVAKAILEIWTGTVTESRAVELAKGMCPNHRVSRDPFLEIFRAIRGTKKPGKPPSNGK